MRSVCRHRQTRYKPSRGRRTAPACLGLPLSLGLAHWPPERPQDGGFTRESRIGAPHPLTADTWASSPNVLGWVQSPCREAQTLDTYGAPRATKQGCFVLCEHQYGLSGKQESTDIPDDPTEPQADRLPNDLRAALALPHTATQDGPADLRHPHVIAPQHVALVHVAASLSCRSTPAPTPATSRRFAPHCAAPRPADRQACGKGGRTRPHHRRRAHGYATGRRIRPLIGHGSTRSASLPRLPR